MKIMRLKFVCPKCKKEYLNNFLASYLSEFKDEAKSFMENNSQITVCENCSTKLVTENLLKFYDANGEYMPTAEKMDISDEVDSFKLYLKTLEVIMNFFSCVRNGRIEIAAQIEKNGSMIDGKMIVKGKSENKEYDLMTSCICQYELVANGDRKNLFKENELKNILNAIISEIYEYLFIDDCSCYYGKKEENIIVCSLI